MKIENEILDKIDQGEREVHYSASAIVFHAATNGFAEYGKSTNNTFVEIQKAIFILFYPS